jgi:hypothetical protein
MVEPVAHGAITVWSWFEMQWTNFEGGNSWHSVPRFSSDEAENCPR